VQVFPVDDGTANRWSWILWFRDSETCQDYSHEWFQDCATAGNPTCEMLHSTKVGNIPGISNEEQAKLVLKWNGRAAQHGHATACVKLARAFLGKLPSSLPNDSSKARALYRRAIRSSNDPDAHYGLASLILEELRKNNDENNNDSLDRAIAHLEAAAMGGHPYAKFNLGMVHLFGYFSKSQKDLTLAADWFEASGLPEGLFARAMYYGSIGDNERATEFRRRASSLGYGTQWRVMARQHTGHGGAGGIDLNLAWPPNVNREIPPQW
jgi:TPR repeat protein